MTEFQLPTDPTPAEMNQCLVVCANNISKIQQLCCEYKANVSIKQTAYKRAFARAIVMNKDLKNATLVKAMAEIDDLVVATGDELDQANAVYVMATGELEGWQAQFVALRKIAEIKKMEIQGRLDGYES